MEPITAEKTMLIGLVATVLIQVLRFILAQKKGIQLGRKPVTVGLFVVAMILAFLWSVPSLPAFPPFPVAVDDPSAFAGLLMLFLGQLIVFLGQLLAVAASIVGFATGIYNLLLQRVFEALGWTAEAPKADPLPPSGEPIGS